jgi:hypothetical protein
MRHGPNSLVAREQKCVGRKGNCCGGNHPPDVPQATEVRVVHHNAHNAHGIHHVYQPYHGILVPVMAEQSNNRMAHVHRRKGLEAIHVREMGVIEEADGHNRSGPHLIINSCIRIHLNSQFTLHFK